MVKEKILTQCKCGKCSFAWFPRTINDPVKCPDCGCRNWKTYIADQAEKDKKRGNK